MRWAEEGKQRLRALLRGGSGAGRAAESAAPIAVPPGQVLGEAVERRAQQIGRSWLEAARQATPSRAASEWLVDRAMQEHAFKVQLFRFVDVFPMLRTPAQVHEVLVEYFTQPGVTLPAGTELGLRAAGLAKGAASKVLARQIETMAERFIAGESAQQALPRLRSRWDEGVAFSVDLLGEACVSEPEAAAYEARYGELIDTLAAEVGGWPSRPLLESGPLGPIPRANVSLKLSSLDPRASSHDVERAAERLTERLIPLLQRAASRGVFVNFDMEQVGLRELVLRVFERCCERVDFAAGVVLQAYLRDSEQDAERVLRWAKRTGRQVTVRLVKGAYWDYETIRSDLEGWPSPVWAHKAQTDASFERLTAKLIAALPRTAGEGGVRLALGSHNARSIAVALACLEREGLSSDWIELQMLYGMANPLKSVAAEQKLRLREYVPIGVLVPGMAYLVRRLLENTSNESWLRAGFREAASEEQLLASPHAAAAARAPLPGQAAPERAAAPAPAGPEVGELGAFRSEPGRDFAVAEQREAFRAAIASAKLPDALPDATVPEAERAIGAALAAFPAWRDAEPRERAACLLRAAQRMRARRDELCALVIRENGKGWSDADGEVCEAIDFCEYYARSAVEWFAPVRLGRFAGELNQPRYEGRGAAAVIAPWNFPFAISCGMAAAALVTGNAVLLKPAEQTPRVARVLAELLWESGVPRAVLQLVPGPGETVGAALVSDPRVSLIAFTGSKAVGFQILEKAGQVPDAQPFVKRVVCEMGGKNAIIVDDTADLDEAVLGVRASAFGYQGQKCSACSRVVVLDGVYDLFLERLVAATRALLIGDPREPDTDVGPLIDAQAAAQVREYIEIGRTEGKLELAMPVPPGLEQRVAKPFVGPHVFSGIERQHRLANEEIFGPVLAVMRASSFEAALAEANATPYKLTGGVFSRQPSHLERARQEFRVGNLYLNRAIAGARVGRQPFGGLGWSGVGAQAGGREYLLQFVQSRTVCENTMRRGFSPEL